MPLLKEKPSELVRKSEVYFSIESGESWRIRSNTSGPSISDIPYWDCEFPENLEHLRNHQALSVEVKKQILFKNAKRLFKL
jgi:hypothetical protein